MNWKDEFVVSEGSPVERELKLWEGLLPENLQKHGMRIVNDRVMIGVKCSEFSFDFSFVNSPLCHKYFRAGIGIGCKRCPIYKKIGASCDENSASHFNQVFETGDPTPMINLLKSIIQEKRK